MKNQVRAKLLPFAIASLLAVAGSAIAQDTSSSINGRVLDGAGKPVANATVQIVHEPSGTTKVTTTDADGRYTAQGLRPGGPFDVKVTKDGTETDKDQVFLQLAQTAAVNITLGASQEATNLSGVSVSASALAQTFNADNKGLSTNISQRELEITPQGNRSIDDIARLDPRISVTDQGDGSISANGLPNRYNNISVDGIGQNDPFGLNANGLPYQSSPISVEAIAEYNISTANFDVASDAVGADINAVTKSGTNDFHGAVYYNYRNASKGVGNAGFLNRDQPGYEYTGYKRNFTGGVTIGGPIIKDKLFFFFSGEREKTQGIGADSNTGLDSTLGNGPSTSNKISPGDLAKVISTAQQLGLQPGTFGAGGVTLDDKRYLGKIDWNITDSHRASLTYQYTKEIQPIVQGNGSNTIGLNSYWYTKESTTKNASLQLFDDWSDTFSTETKIGYAKFDQLAGNALNQPQVRVFLDNAGRGPSVYLGEDQFRHENAIQVKSWTGFFAGTWYLGDHTIKAGLDYERDDIYNLFGRAEHGVYDFYGLTNFQNAQYNSYSLYQPAAGYTLSDVAAQWVYTRYSPFLQDTWAVTDRFSLTAGVRVDIPHTGKPPLYNADFQQAFGYANNITLGSSDRVVEPRLAFNYAFDSEAMTQLRGGVGLFQASPPTVWLTNPYQNNGLTVASYRSGDPVATPFSPDAFAQNRPAGVGAVSGVVDTLAPNFALPTVWKTTLALDRELPWLGMVASIEGEHIETRDAIFYRAVNIGPPTGVLPDGRLQFWATPGQKPSSNPTQVAANRIGAFDRLSTQLANTSKGEANSLTLALDKPFADGWAGNIAFTLNHATEVNPGNSSQASSGYQYVVRTNPNEEKAETADRNIAKSVKISLSWQHAFFGDYNTTVSTFYSGQSGLPYSWIFSGDTNGDGITFEDPVYIPTANDSLVTYGTASPQVVQQFQDYISSEKYLSHHRGQIASRNGDHSPWQNRLDLSLSQEVPGIFKGNKGLIRLDIFNFLNLLDKNWGLTKYTSFGTRTLAGYNGVTPDGKYIYNLPTDQNGNYQAQPLSYYDSGANPTRVVSRWQATLSLKYSF